MPEGNEYLVMNIQYEFGLNYIAQTYSADLVHCQPICNILILGAILDYYFRD